MHKSMGAESGQWWRFETGNRPEECFIATNTRRFHICSFKVKLMIHPW